MEAETTEKVILSDKAYSVAKKLVILIIPALSALYFALSEIWNLPAADKVTGTLAIIAAFIGGILGISSKQYNNSDVAFDGDIITTKADGKTTVMLALHDDVGVEDKKVLRFKVKPTHIPREHPLEVGDELDDDDDDQGPIGPGSGFEPHGA